MRRLRSRKGSPHVVDPVAMAHADVSGARILAGVPVHHFPCRHGRHECADHRAVCRSLGDSALAGAQNRPACARLRHGNPFDQERHTHDGGRADFAGNCLVHPVVGRSGQPFCLDRDDRHFRIRRHWLGR